MGPLEFIVAATVLVLSVILGGLTAKWLRKYSRKNTGRKRAKG